MDHQDKQSSEEEYEKENNVENIKEIGIISLRHELIRIRCSCEG